MNESIKTGRCQHVTAWIRITRILTDYAQNLPGHLSGHQYGLPAKQILKPHVSFTE